jgi:hypothetical protein
VSALGLAARARPHGRRQPIGARAQAMGGVHRDRRRRQRALLNVAGPSRLGHQEFTSTLGSLYGVGLSDNHLG